MPMYKYKAINADKKNVSGIMFAQNERHLLDVMLEQKLYCTEITEQAEDDGRSKGYRLSLKELSIFSRQMAVMLNAGMSLVNALYILYERCEKKKTKEIYLALYESVQQGSYFSDAMIATSAFPLLMTSMVEAGEASGTLVNSMDRMSDHYARENKIKHLLINSMIYPTVLLVVAVAVVILVLVVVLPSFFDMFAGAELPALTKVMMGLSNSLINYWYVYIFFIAVAVVVIRIYLRSEKGRLKFDEIKTKFPAVSKYTRTIYTSRCARGISSLYSCGIPLIRTLEITAKLIGNTYVASKFDDIIEAVQQGDPMSSAFDRSQLFDPLFYSMILVGEESGSIDTLLEKTTYYYDEEIESATAKLLGILEPVMIVFMGLIVALVLLAIYPAIYSMYGSI